MKAIKIAEAVGYTYELIMQDNAGYARADMPQIRSRLALADVLVKLANTYTVKPMRVRLGDLKFTQNEIDVDKVNDMIKNGLEKNPFYITSSDYRIVDGHHDFSARLEVEGSDAEVTIYRVDLPINKLIQSLNAMKHTEKAI